MNKIIYYVPDDTFLKCYKTNINKIIKYKSGKFELNKLKCNEWIERQKTDFRKEIASTFIDAIEYVTYKDLFELVKTTIRKVYQQINCYQEIDSPDKPIYLYVGNPTKSFYFISLIALYFIKKLKLPAPKYYISNFQNEKNDYTINADFSNIIMLDDMSYSGSQLNNLLARFRKGIPHLKLYIGLTGVNAYSYSLLIQNNNANVVYGKMFELLIEKVGIEKYYYISYYFSPFYVPNVLIYFDHKLADNPSTFYNTLLYGPVIPDNYVFIDFDNDCIQINYPHHSMYFDKFKQLYDKFIIDNNSKTKWDTQHIVKIQENVSKCDLKYAKYADPYSMHFNTYVKQYIINRVTLIRKYLHEKILSIENKTDLNYSVYSKFFKTNRMNDDTKIEYAYMKRKENLAFVNEFVPFINNCERIVQKNIENIQRLQIPYGLFNYNTEKNDLSKYCLFDLYHNIEYAPNNTIFKVITILDGNELSMELDEDDLKEYKINKDEILHIIHSNMHYQKIIEFIANDLYEIRCPLSCYKKDFFSCKKFYNERTQYLLKNKTLTRKSSIKKYLKKTKRRNKSV